MADKIRVAVAGAAGRMGRAAVRAVAAAPDMTLAAALGRERGVGQDAGTVAGTRGSAPAPAVKEEETITGVRGGRAEGIRVHSVRLPGLAAHQEVIFGGPGQTLVIRHDSVSEESFMPGLMLAARKVRSLTGLVYGLEKLLEL